MVKVQDIVQYLATVAPWTYQEHYDNVGLLVGDAQTPVTGVLLCLDVNQDVLQEAQAHRCNLVVAHHPLIFSPLKKLVGQTYVERCVAYSIKHDLAICAVHTNLDNTAQGTNKYLADQLGLKDPQILLPKQATQHKLTTWIPEEALAKVRNALHAAGAGQLGYYTKCSFSQQGVGTFCPTPSARPSQGQRGSMTTISEQRLEVFLPSHLADEVVQALLVAHPYERPVYALQALNNAHEGLGAGMIGDLCVPQEPAEFLHHIKRTLHCTYVRHTSQGKQPIRRVAVCGGRGSFLLQAAMRNKADALVTADITYHDFFAAQNLLLVDVGHYESEVGNKYLLYEYLAKKFSPSILHICATVTNPVHHT